VPRKKCHNHLLQMGLDWKAVTVVGVKFPLAKLVRIDGKYLDSEFYDQRLSFGDDFYALHVERYGDKRDKSVYICIWCGKKDSHAFGDNVKCPLGPAELEQKSELLKHHLVGAGFLSEAEFHEWNGIYTLIYASW